MDNPNVLFLDWAKENLNDEQFALAVKMEEHNKSLVNGHNGRMLTDLKTEIENPRYHYTFMPFDDYCWQNHKNGIYSLADGQFVIAGYGIEYAPLRNVNIGGNE